MTSRLWLIQVPGIARTSLSQALRGDGFHVDEFDGIHEALKQIELVRPPRVILLCLLTCAETAAQLARGLASRPEWARVPVLGLTTQAQPHTLEVLEPWLGAVRVLCGEG